MENRKESYPATTVIVSNIVAVSIYAIGAWILAGLGIWVSILFVLYCLVMELRVLKHSCRDCYYYGRVCGFGKGVICSLFFKRGDPARFACKEVTWTDLAPDFLVPILPLIGGAVVLIRDFQWPVAVLMAALVLLASAGTGFVRASLVCKHCKQAEIGCPAAKLFAHQAQ